jgi:hypothetical protein
MSYKRDNLKRKKGGPSEQFATVPISDTSNFDTGLHLIFYVLLRVRTVGT